MNLVTFVARLINIAIAYVLGCDIARVITSLHVMSFVRA